MVKFIKRNLNSTAELYRKAKGREKAQKEKKTPLRKKEESKRPTEEGQKAPKSSYQAIQKH